MQLIYLADTFEDNYNILRDRFETESVNVMKYMSLVAKKQKVISIYQLASVYQTTMRTVTTKNNTQIVRKPYWFVRNSCENSDDLEKYWATCYPTCNL